MESDAPLAQLCAQDMFSSFMKSLAPLLKHSFEIAPEPRPHSQGFEPVSSLGNALSKTIKKIEKTGLGNSLEISASLIPALSEMNKLQINIDALTERARERSKHYLGRR